MTPYIADRLDRLALNVSALEASITFYTEALGFVAGGIGPDAGLAARLGVRAVRCVRLARGAQSLQLSQCDPPGAPYPAERHSNDRWFAHCALASTDIAGDFARLGGHAVTPISRHGPQVLPGGIVAFKFRDPDGHPLELIQFPRPDPRTAGGIDHCAISVADSVRSAAFYASMLGLTETARQVNSGPAQVALDDLEGVRVDVVAMMPRVPAPHLELLGYRQPPGHAGLAAPGDIAASRRVFVTEGGHGISRDPDGHLFEVEAKQAVLF